MSKRILSQILRRSRSPVKQDSGRSQISSWAKIKDFAVTLGAISGILAGVLWMGGRFYTYGYFERMNIPIYFLDFSAAEYAEVYITSIAAKLIVYIITNFSAILIGIVLALAVGIILWIIQKRYKNLKFRDALEKIENINNKFLIISFLILFLASFFMAYNSGDVAAQHLLMNSRTVAVYSREMLPLGISLTTITSNEQPSLFEFKDLYLLTYNNGKYYFFRELDMVTCKPKQLYIIADSDLISVNIGEAVTLPECPSSLYP